ncbi:MAG: hypothetical protein ACR2PR_08700 [Pseudohongiellaceae bacterium]
MTAVPTRFPEGVTQTAKDSFLALTRAPFPAGPAVGQPVEYCQDFMQDFVPPYTIVSDGGGGETFLLTRSDPFGVLRYVQATGQTATVARLDGVAFTVRTDKSLWYQTRIRVFETGSGFRIGLGNNAGVTTFTEAIYFISEENETDISIEVRNGGTLVETQVIGTAITNGYMEMAYWIDERLNMHVYFAGREVAVISLVLASTPIGIPLTPFIALAEAGAETPEIRTDYINVAQDR